MSIYFSVVTNHRTYPRRGLVYMLFCSFICFSTVFGLVGRSFVLTSSSVRRLRVRLRVFVSISFTLHLSFIMVTVVLPALPLAVAIRHRCLRLLA